MDSACPEPLERLTASLAECTDGVGQLALVMGGLASGKTHLIHEFSRRAKTVGALYLTATGSRAERGFPSGIIDQLCRNAEIPAEVADRISLLLARHHPPDPGPGTAEARAGDAAAVPHTDTEARIIHAICVELLELARQRPLVIGIDDIQFVDPFSLRLILHLRRRVASARVMIVLTEWTWGHPALTRFHAEITQQPHLKLQLGELPPSGIADLLAGGTESKYRDERARAFHRLTGGNPLLVRALLEDYRALRLAHSETAGEDETAGPAFGRAVLECLYRWDNSLLQVAQGLAVLGDDASPGLVGSLVSLPAVSVEQVLHVLSAAGLLSFDGLHYRHPAARNAVLSTLTSAVRNTMHRTAAELLQHRGADPTTVAGHLLTAGSAVGDWSVAVLRSAAATAAADDNVDLVVRCLQLAMDSCTDPAESGELRRSIARTVWRVDPASAGRYHTASRTALRNGSLAERDMLPLIKQSLWQGDLETARAAADAYVKREGERDRYAEAELHLAYRWFYGPLAKRGPSGEDRRNARPGVRTGDPNIEDPWIRAVNAMANGRSRPGTKTAVPSADHILESCRLGDTLLEVVLAALLTLVRGNQSQRASEHCENLYAEAVRRGGPTWQAMLGAVRADIALGRGQLEDAITHARSALALLPVQGWGVMYAYPLSTLIQAHTSMGDDAAAEESVRRMTSDTTPTTFWGLRFLHARGRHYLAIDRVLAAVKDFQTCGRLAHDFEHDVAGLVPWRTSLAEANLRLGRPVVARDLVKQQLHRAQGVDLRSEGVSLRLLAATSELPQRPALLRKSVDLLQASGDRMELARALADLSEAYRDTGNLDEARATSWRAIHETKICRSGTDQTASLIPEQRKREPVGVERPADDAGRTERPEGADVAPEETSTLSDAECRVAQLAARGFSNRDIGHQLFITVSTVEQHLTRVYRKLGVNNRRALPTLLPSPELQSI